MTAPFQFLNADTFRSLRPFQKGNAVFQSRKTMPAPFLPFADIAKTIG